MSEKLSVEGEKGEYRGDVVVNCFLQNIHMAFFYPDLNHFLFDA